jgi:tetratricopeptide (TPR) repeat protein
MSPATQDRALAALFEELREDVARHPTWPDRRHVFALLLIEKGDLASARAQLDAALARNPKYADARKTYAFLELAAGDYAGAVAQLERLLAMHAEDWRAQVGAGLLHLAAGHLGAALPRLEEAVRLAPERPLPAFALAHAQQRAGVTGDAGFTRASSRFAALAERGRDAAIIGNPCRAYIAREAAFRAAQEGDQGGALAWLDRALALDLDEAADAAARGELLFAGGDMKAAIAAFERAIAIEPDLVKPRVSLAYALGVEGNLDGAIAQIEAAIKRKPKYADLRYQLAVLLLDRGERLRAISQLEAALGVNPNYAAAHFSLALLRYVDGRFDEAEARFASARAGGFSPDESLAYMGFCALKRADFATAAARFRDAAAADESLGLARLGLAILKAREGDGPGAQAELRRYYELESPPASTEHMSEIERAIVREARELEKRLGG